MAEWTLSGTYVSACACEHICPCAVGEAPSGPKGQCLGAAVFHVASGNFGDVDLSGLDLAMYNLFPKVAREGGWTIGFVASETANDAQVDALGKIVSGKEGGPFADWLELVAANKGVERGKVVFSGDKASVAGKTEIEFEPYLGLDGAPTSIVNAPGGVNHEYKIGKSKGYSDAFGIKFDANYGEAAAYEFTNKMGHAEIKIRGT